MYATIKGTVFHDTDHNGSYSSHHSGIAGVVLILESPQHELLTATTDSNGKFYFPELHIAGKYVLYESVSLPKCFPKLPESFPQPFGYNGSTTPRRYSLTIPNEAIHSEVTFDHFNFGHDFSEPFDATSLVYQVDDQSSTLYTLNLVTGATTPSATFNIKGHYHTLSYNPLDHYLYGYDINCHKLFRITPLGVVTYYTVFNLPQKNYMCVAINPLGQLYLYEPQDIDFYVVAINSHSPDYMQLIIPQKGLSEEVGQIGIPTLPMILKSWSFNPKDGNLYGLNQDGCVVQINPKDGVSHLVVTTGTPLAQSVTTVFDYSGTLYCIFEGTMAVYRILLDATQAFAELFTPLTAPLLKGGARCGDVPLYTKFGTAPDLSPDNAKGDYHTSLANNGPRHALTHTLMLGDTGNHSFVLDMPPLLITDTTYTVQIPIINRTGHIAYLYGWLDLNQNGIFEVMEATDIIEIPSTAHGTFEALMHFALPKNHPMSVGRSYCRIRLTSDLLTNTNTDSSGVDTRSLGPASDGDVGDFEVTITGIPPEGTTQMCESCYMNESVTSTCAMTDPSGGSLSFKIMRSPTSGKLTIDSSNGKWQYTPSTNYVGEDAFIIRCTSSISSLYTDIHVFVYTLLVDVELSLSANLREVTPEDVITYTAKLKNISSIPLNHISISNLLPFGCYFIPESVIINTVHANSVDVTLSVPIATLAPQEEYTLSFQCQVSDDMTTIEGCARVTYNYVLNPDTPSYTKEKTSIPVVITVKKPHLDVALASDVYNVLAGDSVQFTLTLTNSGNIPLQNIRIYSRLATFLTYVGELLINEHPAYANLLTGYALESLLPEKTVKLQFIAKTADIISHTILESVFKVDYDYLLGENTHAKSLKSPTHLLTVHVPSFELSKTSNKPSVSLSEVFYYTYTLHNNCDLVVEQVTLQDTLPSVFEILELTCDKELLTNTLQSGIMLGQILPHTSKSIVVQVKATARLSESMLRSLKCANALVKLKLPQTQKTREINLKASEDTEIFITDAALHLDCTLSTTQATVGETITYTLHLTNTGTVTLNEVLIQDLLSPELKFLPHSVTIDGKPHTTASIISGITLNNLGVNASSLITFEVVVIAKASKQIDCQLSAYYTYGLNSSKPMKTGHTVSNACLLTLHYVGVEISGHIQQPVAFLNDEIHYTIKIKNIGDTPVFNMVLRNESASYDLVDSSFKMNETLINSVDLSNGINLGSLAPHNNLLITYSQKISENYYPLDNLTSTLATSFSYSNHDQSIKYGHSNTLSLAIPLALSTFKQFDLENYFEILDYKPDLEHINMISGNIHLIKHYVIKTPTGTSTTHQKLTHHTLVFHGNLELTAEYVSNEAAHSIYSSYHTLPFSAFIVLPEDFPVHSHIRINPTLQNVTFKMINNRAFFASASILAIAYIK